MGYRDVYENIKTYFLTQLFDFALAMFSRDDIFIHHKVWKYNLSLTKNFKTCYQKGNLSMAEAKYGTACGL